LEPISRQNLQLNMFSNPSARTFFCFLEAEKNHWISGSELLPLRPSVSKTDPVIEPERTGGKVSEPHPGSYWSRYILRIFWCQLIQLNLYPKCHSWAPKTYLSCKKVSNCNFYFLSFNSFIIYVQHLCGLLHYYK
jgi:hypothetical protein